MGLVTEMSLRAEIRNKNIDRYVVKAGTKVTPSAMQYLKDRSIELVYEEEKAPEALKGSESVKTEERPSAKYVFGSSGCFMSEKPEYMTQLYGNKLVYKDHPRIEFRGRLDSLQSEILMLQVKAAESRQDKLLKELEEVLQYVRNILRCEVLEEPFPGISILNLNDDELRAQSHNPVKYFNMKHVLPDYTMGETTIDLNSLRSSVREVEISAVKAFRRDEGVLREDLIKALNRLSSCIYIMMLKCISGAYK